MEGMERLKKETILVTGGTGFVGSHVVERLIHKGYRVIIPFRTINPFSYFQTQKLDRYSILTHCDIRDSERVFDVIIRYEIDYILHLLLKL
jgi:UDP-glucose 4-epimerase